MAIKLDVEKKRILYAIIIVWIFIIAPIIFPGTPKDCRSWNTSMACQNPEIYLYLLGMINGTLVLLAITCVLLAITLILIGVLEMLEGNFFFFKIYKKKKHSLPKPKKEKR